MKAIKGAVNSRQGLHLVIKHTPTLMDTHAHTHLLLKGLQVHLSVRVVDSCG